MPTQKRRRFLIRQRQKRRTKRKEVMNAIKSDKDPFLVLKKIIAEGFKGQTALNVSIIKRYGSESDLAALSMGTFSIRSNFKETYGDRYAIKMLTNVRAWSAPGKKSGGVKFAHPEQVKKIYVFINSAVSENEKAKRMLFYKKEFPNIPMEFVK